jgi:hypothetical protein
MVEFLDIKRYLAETTRDSQLDQHQQLKNKELPAVSLMEHIRNLDAEERNTVRWQIKGHVPNGFARGLLYCIYGLFQLEQEG